MSALAIAADLIAESNYGIDFQHTFFMPYAEDVDVTAMIDSERNVEIVSVRHTASRRKFRPTANQRVVLEAAALAHHDEMWSAP